MPCISKFSEKPGDKKDELRQDVLLDQQKTRISTSNIRTEASETVVLFDKATAAPNRHGLV